MRVARADIPFPFLSVPSFHFDCTGKEDVILEVNVLVKVGFKVCQCFV